MDKVQKQSLHYNIQSKNYKIFVLEKNGHTFSKPSQKMHSFRLFLTAYHTHKIPPNITKCIYISTTSP